MVPLRSPDLTLQVVKAKEGWLDVKEAGKVKSRWVVLKEDTLLYYKDTADAKPIGQLDAVHTYELSTKKGVDICTYV